MSRLSTKPYLFDGFYRWCLDTGETPFLDVCWTPSCVLPADFMDLQRITFNLSPEACRHMTVDAKGLSFLTRLQGGHWVDIFLPLESFLRVFSKESGKELPLDFPERLDESPPPTIAHPTPSLLTPAAPTLSMVPALPARPRSSPSLRRPTRPRLTLVSNPAPPTTS